MARLSVDDTPATYDHDGRMNDDDFWQQLGAELEDYGVLGPLSDARPLAGGCIHAAMRVATGDGRSLFVKQATPDQAEAFAAESEGLAELAAPQALRVPRPIAHGVIAGRAYLVTEFVELHGTVTDAATFGAALARLHATTSDAFGWQRDNFIGPTPQPNGRLADWTEFWRQRRLRPQLEHAQADGNCQLAERGWRLAERLEALLADHRPPPALLHGDLWAGNYGGDGHGRPVLFDPAVYYGDREADLAMTELFGGFPSAFYEGYDAEWPLDAGYATRKQLYNLYHLLNHAHLFGGGYASQSRQVIDGLLAEIE